MLKKIVIGVVLMVGTIVSAQQTDKLNFDADCFPAENLIAGLAEKYGELPLMLGDSDRNAKVVIFINKRTKSYSVVLFDKSVKRGCIIDSGEKLAPKGMDI